MSTRDFKNCRILTTTKTKWKDLRGIWEKEVGRFLSKLDSWREENPRENEEKSEEENEMEAMEETEEKEVCEINVLQFVKAILSRDFDFGKDIIRIFNDLDVHMGYSGKVDERSSSPMFTFKHSQFM